MFLKFQFEIREIIFTPGEERLPVYAALADNFSLAYGPIRRRLLGLRMPALQGLAVEDRAEAVAKRWKPVELERIFVK